MAPSTPSTTDDAFPDLSGTEGWRVLGGRATAWFAAGSHSDAALLSRAVSELCGGAGLALPDLDLRSTGVRVRLGSDATVSAAVADLASAISDAARRLGLEPRPGVLQELGLRIDTRQVETVTAFWESALGYQRQAQHGLADPLRRHPPLRFQQMDAPRPLRNRLHLDSVAAQPVASGTVDCLASAGALVAHHGYYATVADAEGNEVDLLPLPADTDRWDVPDIDDWRLVFSAVAVYPTATIEQADRLVTVAAEIADRAGISLLLDVRRAAPGGDPAGRTPQTVVVLDTGKDRWEMDERYLPLCRRVQQEARSLGLTAAPERARFVQVGIEAADVPATRSFWQAVLGYEADPRSDVTDIVDPNRLGPVLFFQPLDPDDTARRTQRNRLHLEAAVPHDVADAKVSTALRAGGTVVRDDSPTRWTLADPEGNEIDVVVDAAREEGRA
ncbi:VOC family protein [uncultured Serinicoccus sp.]|uniref:VOC family protein n=1 Tax=uncultured Serinicoccus sp. TaxID=735514 RepID=UPI0026039B6A|nr:VOC family protein [uncultured Serinicoccus sp.]